MSQVTGGAQVGARAPLHKHVSMSSSSSSKWFSETAGDSTNSSNHASHNNDSATTIAISLVPKVSARKLSKSFSSSSRLTRKDSERQAFINSIVSGNSTIHLSAPMGEESMPGHVLPNITGSTSPTSSTNNQNESIQALPLHEHSFAKSSKKGSVSDVIRGYKRRAMSTDMRRVTTLHDTVSPIKTMISGRFLSKSLSSGHSGLFADQQVPLIKQSVKHDGENGSDSLVPGIINQFEDNVSLEVWPANVDAYDDSKNHMNKMIAKPKVLLELERHLEQLLMKYQMSPDGLEKDDSFDITHIQPYRECFRMFVDQFKTYKPFLTKIRNVYENAIEYAIEKVRDTEYLQNQINLLEEEFRWKTDEKIVQYTQDFLELQNLNRSYKQRIEELEQMNQPYQDEVNKKGLEIRRLEEENNSLEATIFNLKEVLRRMEGGNKAWGIDIETLNMLEEEQKKVRELQERGRLKDRQLRKLQDAIEGHKGGKDDPQLVEMKNKLTKRNTDYLRLKAQISLLHGRFGRLEKEKIREQREVERLQKRLEPFMEENANLTPRPAWNDIISNHPKVLTPFRAETTRETTTKLVEVYISLKSEHDTTLKELEEARNFIGLASRDSRVEDVQSNERVKKWFLGLGTGGDVPKFLQFRGKISNRKFAKVFTEEMINEFWEKKEEADEELNVNRDKRKKRKRIPAKEFYYRFLEKKAMEEITEEEEQYPSISFDPDEIEKRKQKKIAEWGYSMLDSLRKALYDPDCEMFYKIVYENMSEDVFHEQNDMIQSVKEMLQKMKDKELENDFDDEEDDTLTNTSGETELLKSDILKCLREMFPLKPEESFRRLIVCLNKDFPGLYVDFIQLFEEDEDYNQREFVEEIRHQFVAEREDFIEEIEESVIECDANNDGVILLSEIYQAILQVDPLRPINQVDNIIAQGLNVSVDDLDPILSQTGSRKYKGRLSTPISKFVERIRQLYVRRYTAVADRDRVVEEMKKQRQPTPTLLRAASTISNRDRD